MQAEKSYQFDKFLKSYNDSISELSEALRDWVIDVAHPPYELWYDSYNAFSMAFSLEEQLEGAFVHIAVYTDHVNLGFNKGAKLDDPEDRLEGSGELIRHVKIYREKEFPDDYLEQLILDARELALENSDLNEIPESDEPEILIKTQ